VGDAIKRPFFPFGRSSPSMIGCGELGTVETSVRVGIISPFARIASSPVAAANLELISGGICFHGHTHVPGIFGLLGDQVTHEYQIDTFPLRGPSLVNPGSVGQPRDGSPMASYGVWDVENETFEFRRVRYDIKGAQRAITKAQLPERFALRLETGR